MMQAQEGASPSTRVPVHNFRLLQQDGSTSEMRADDFTTVEEVHKEVERLSGIPVRRQLLFALGTPLVSQAEALKSALGGYFCDLSVREVEEKWVETLKAAAAHTSSYEQLRTRLRVEAQATFQCLQDERAVLDKRVTEMAAAFQVVLSELMGSGTQLLSVAGDLQRNRDVVLDTGPRTSKACRVAAEELTKCRHSVLEAAQGNGKVLLHVGAQLALPHKAVVASLRDLAQAVAAAKEALQREREVLYLGKAKAWLLGSSAEDALVTLRSTLESVVNESYVLGCVAHELTRCRQAFKRAMAMNHTAIKHAEASLQKDQEIVFTWALEHVSDFRKCDRDFIYTVVEANGEALEKIPECFRSDRDLVTLALRKSNGWALQYASPELQRDKELVLTAVRMNGWALEHAAQEMRQDAAVVMAAVETTGMALDFASKELKSNRSIVLAAIRKSGGNALKCASEELKQDRSVGLAAVHENGLMLEHVATALKDDQEVVSEAVKANGLALEHASARLRGVKEVAMRAVQSNPAALRFASDEMKANKEVVETAVAKDGCVLLHAAPALRRNRDVVLLAATEAGPLALEFAHEDLRRDPALIQAASKESRRRLAKEREQRKALEDFTWCAPETDTERESTVLGLKL